MSHDTTALPVDHDARLKDADAIHDDRPETALAMLREIPPAALPVGRRARYAFLMNHVAGEKFGLWPEALAAQRAVVEATGDAMTPLLWRQAAVCARLAGDATLATAWRDAFAHATQAPVAEVEALLGLAGCEFTASTQDAARAGREAGVALAAVPARFSSSLDTAFAAAANNIANHFVERPLEDLRAPELRAAMTATADLALRCWSRAGTWVQQERARYLAMLAANAVGDATAAEVHARAALALLDEHDTAHAEDVDRAFVELELAQALRLADKAGADAAQDRAETLAAAFPEAWLGAWFADRRQRNAALLAQHRRG